MTETSFQEIDEALSDIKAPASATPRTDVAVTSSTAIDLAKVDIHAVVRAQFAAGRAEAETALKELGSVVLDLSSQAKINEAKSLRERRINVPIADMRKLGKGQRSALSQAGKTSSAEEEAVVGIFTKARDYLTQQIDPAQKKIDDEKEAKRQAEVARLAALREAVTEALAAWAERCREEGITAERIGRGVAMLEQLEPDAAWAEVESFWQTTKAQTLATMRGLQAAAQQREDAARIEAQRLENERIAAENARIAAEAAAESARVAAAAAAEKAAAEALMEQARQMLAAAEAKRLADEQAAIQAIREQHEAAERREQERHAAEQAEIEAARQRAEAPAANVATAAATEGTADTPEPGTLEAAPIQEQPHGLEAAAPSEACAGEAPRHQAVAQDAVGEPAADPGVGSGDPERGSDVASAEHGSSDGPQDAAGLSGLSDEAGRGVAAAAESAEVDTTSEAAPQQASVQFLSNELDIARAGYSHEADTAPATISDTMRDRVTDLQALKREALESRFPSQPKMPPEWWAAFFAAVDSLAAEVA